MRRPDGYFEVLVGGCPTSLAKASYDAHCPLGQYRAHHGMAEICCFELTSSRLKSRNHLDFLPSRFVAEPVIGRAFARSVGSLQARQSLFLHGSDISLNGRPNHLN